jgi:hypothetical protein
MYMGSDVYEEDEEPEELVNLCDRIYDDLCARLYDDLCARLYKEKDIAH